MIDPLNSIGSSLIHPIEDRLNGVVSREAVKNEFYALFLREVLKQTFKSNLEKEEESNPLAMPIVNDVLIDRLSLELAEQFREAIP